MSARTVDDYAREALAYCEAVLSGTEIAGEWVKAAARRHLEDMDRAESDSEWPYYYDRRAAGRMCAYIERLHHVVGDWAKRDELIRLEPWQVFAFGTPFGWLRRADGLRRFRLVYLEVARKNAKSTAAAAVGLYLFAHDGEQGSQVYSAATKRTQARIVWETARSMVQRDPIYTDRYGIEVKAHELRQKATNSVFTALDSEGTTLDGLNIHGAVIDELHAHKKRALWDVLETATAARRQPLIWAITTAGTNRSGICYEVRSYVTKILRGAVDDPTVFGAIYTLDPDDDWQDRSVWRKANPNLNVSVYQDELERLAEKAASTRSAVPNFMTKHLNMWVGSGAAWMDLRAYEACADDTLKLEDFTNEPCWIGCDLASTKDIASVALLFERDGVVYQFTRHYVPEDMIEAAENDSYAGWRDRGWLQATPGAMIDINRIEADILADADRFRVQAFCYDPHQATQMVANLMDAGLECVQVRPTVLNFSQPMKHLEGCVLAGTWRHDADPVMTWMVSNVHCWIDEKDNIYPRKEVKGSPDKIDGVIAVLTALHRMLAGEESARIEIPDGYSITA